MAGMYADFMRSYWQLRYDYMVNRVFVSTDDGIEYVVQSIEWDSSALAPIVVPRIHNSTNSNTGNTGNTGHIGHTGHTGHIGNTSKHPGTRPTADCPQGLSVDYVIECFRRGPAVTMGDTVASNISNTNSNNSSSNTSNNTNSNNSSNFGASSLTQPHFSASFMTAPHNGTYAAGQQPQTHLPIDEADLPDQERISMKGLHERLGFALKMIAEFPNPQNIDIFSDGTFQVTVRNLIGYVTSITINDKLASVLSRPLQLTLPSISGSSISSSYTLRSVFHRLLMLLHRLSNPQEERKNDLLTTARYFAANQLSIAGSRGEFLDRLPSSVQNRFTLTTNTNASSESVTPSLVNGRPTSLPSFLKPIESSAVPGSNITKDPLMIVGQWIRFRDCRSQSWTRAKVRGRAGNNTLFDLGFEFNSLTNCEVWLELPNGQLQQVQWMNSLPTDVAQILLDKQQATETRIKVLSAEHPPPAVSSGVRQASEMDGSLIFHSNNPFRPTPFDDCDVEKNFRLRAFRVGKPLLNGRVLDPVSMEELSKFDSKMERQLMLLRSHSLLSYVADNDEVVDSAITGSHSAKKPRLSNNIMNDENIKQTYTPRLHNQLDAEDCHWVTKAMRASPTWAAHAASKNDGWVHCVCGYCKNGGAMASLTLDCPMLSCDRCHQAFHQRCCFAYISHITGHNFNRTKASSTTADVIRFMIFGDFSYTYVCRQCTSNGDAHHAPLVMQSSAYGQPADARQQQVALDNTNVHLNIRARMKEYFTRTSIDLPTAIQYVFIHAVITNKGRILFFKIAEITKALLDLWNHLYVDCGQIFADFKSCALAVQKTIEEYPDIYLINPNDGEGFTLRLYVNK